MREKAKDLVYRITQVIQKYELPVLMIFTEIPMISLPDIPLTIKAELPAPTLLIQLIASFMELRAVTITKGIPLKTASKHPLMSAIALQIIY